MILKARSATDAPVKADSGIYPYVVVLVLAATLLQRIALPGTGNALPVSTIVLPATAALAWYFGHIRIREPSLVLWAAFVAIGGGSLWANKAIEPVSIPSLALIAMVQGTLMFRLSSKAHGSVEGMRFFVNLMVVLSVLGAAQFFLQDIVGKETVFFMDYYVPQEIKLDAKAYNSLNELYYGAGLYKSNGLFFTEPSFFCQFAAIAMVIELSTRKRVWCIAGLGAGMLASYSGTGLIVLGLFLAVLAWRSKRKGLVLLVVAGVALLLLPFAEDLKLDRTLERAGEFSSPDSSGHARFVSIFVLLGNFVFNDVFSALIGKGPGTVSEYFHRVPFEAHAPTWGKALFEYGLIGMVVYIAFLVSGSFSWKSPLMLPIFVNYLFMGGYLGDATIVTTLFAFLILGPKEWSRPSGARRRSRSVKRLQPPGRAGPAAPREPAVSLASPSERPD